MYCNMYIANESDGEARCIYGKYGDVYFSIPSFSKQQLSRVDFVVIFAWCTNVCRDLKNIIIKHFVDKSIFDI